MARDFKIHNDEDKTIFAVKVEEPAKNKKGKGASGFIKFLIILIALALSVGVGYLLHLMK